MNMALRPMPQRTSAAALDHAAILYDGRAALLAAVVPFVREALESGGVVVAVTTAATGDALAAGLAAQASGVLFAGAESVYTHPVRALAAYDRFVRRHRPARVWVLAEPFWRTFDRPDRWVGYEAAVNAAFADSGAQVRCLYDTGFLAPAVVDGVLLTHPILIDALVRRPNPGYRDARSVLSELRAAPLPGPPQVPLLIPLAEGQLDIRALRHDLAVYATTAGMAEPAVRLMLIAVCEVAANAAKHGTDPMQVRVWHQGGALVVEVIDCGHWRPDPLLGWIPPEPGLGFGMWSARLLADAVDIRTGWSGTTVRLTFPISSGQARP